MRTHFVGRHRELAGLEATLQEVRESRGQLVLLVGEAGIGKTRTTQEFAEHASSKSVGVHWGRCHDESDVPAFWPWVQLIRSYAQSVSPEALRADLGPGAGVITQLVPSLLDRLPDVPTPTHVTASEARFRLFDAIAELFRAASKRRPLTLVIDDLHWADEASLHLLNFAASNLRDASILFLAAARRFRAARDSRRAKLFAELTRVSRRVRLSGLDSDAVGQLMSDVANADASPEMIAAIHERTRGNPFFIDELMRLILEEGSLTNAENVRIPDEVRTAILRRLDHLDTNHRAILGAAAVIGREFDINLLAQASLTSAGELLDLLESPALAGIVDHAPETPGGYQFYHALVRETLSADLEPSERIALHRRIGDALEQGSQPDRGAHLSAIAYHYLEARRGGEDIPAAAFAQRAGDRALELLAYEQAAAHYRDGLDGLQLEGPDESRSLELLLSMGDAHSLAGEAKLARRAFERASAAARELGSDVALARAALGSARAVETGWGDRRLVPLLEEALQHLPKEDSILRAGILGRLAMAISYSDDAETHARAGVEMARRLEDDKTLAQALICLHYVLWGQTLAEERLALTREAIALSERAGDGPSVLEAASWAIQDLLELARIDEVDQELRRYTARAAELRMPRYLWHSTMVQSTRAAMSGDFERSEKFSIEALTYRSPDAPNAAMIHNVQLYCLYREQGRLASFLEPMRKLADENPAVPIWRCGFAALHIETNDRLAAEREFERFAANDFKSLPKDANRIASLALLAEVCNFLEDRERAEVLDALLAPLSHLTIIVATSVGYFGPVARFRGLLATTLGRYRDAEELFEASLEELSRAGIPTRVAHTEYDLARMLLLRNEAGDAERAHELLERVIKTAGAFGMPDLLKRGEQLIGPSTIPAADSATVSTTHSDAADPSDPIAELRAIFRREGDYWTIALGAESTRIKHSIGLGYIDRLLREPGREFHVLDLSGLNDAATQDTGDAGEHMDPQARAQYAARLTDLREELAEAERWDDSGRAARAQQEIEFLGAELSRAVGLGGRARRASSSTERARVNTTRALRRALKKISEEDSSLGGRLSSCIRTGTFCSYEPDPLNPLDWTF